MHDHDQRNEVADKEIRGNEDGVVPIRGVPLKRVLLERVNLAAKNDKCEVDSGSDEADGGSRYDDFEEVDSACWVLLWNKYPLHEFHHPAPSDQIDEEDEVEDQACC